MTKRQRIITAIRGEMPDRIPFTCKFPTLPKGELEHQLRNEGMTFVLDCPVFEVLRPNIEKIRREYMKEGVLFEQEVLSTPKGDISRTLRKGKFGKVCMDHFIKRPEDYKVAEFIIRDEKYVPTYERFRRKEEIWGDEGFVLGGWLPPSPLMDLIWNWFGEEQFAFELIDGPERFFSFYELIKERQIEQYHIAAESPSLVLHGEENMTSVMIGRGRFEQYCVPCYNTFASILHSKGKLLALHMDGLMKDIADAINTTGIDIIEAFCPSPDGDLSMAEARRKWPNKVIWINFPSPVHLMDRSNIESYTRNILKDVAPGNNFLFGITEDLPEQAWQNSLPIISRVLKEEGSLPISV